MVNAGDNLEAHLAEFFRSERPEPWPPAPSALVSPRRFATDSARASRFALAISLAAVLLIGWTLAGRIARPAGSTTFDDTTATKPSELRSLPSR